jgi:hypothetical protein
MSVRIFKCVPKFSLYEYCTYWRNNICTMFSAHWITPDALSMLFVLSYIRFCVVGLPLCFLETEVS